MQRSRRMNRGAVSDMKCDQYDELLLLLQVDWQWGNISEDREGGFHFAKEDALYIGHQIWSHHCYMNLGDIFDQSKRKLTCWNCCCLKREISTKRNFIRIFFGLSGLWYVNKSFWEEWQWWRQVLTFTLISTFPPPAGGQSTKNDFLWEKFFGGYVIGGDNVVGQCDYFSRKLVWWA